MFPILIHINTVNSVSKSLTSVCIQDNFFFLSFPSVGCILFSNSLFCRAYCCCCLVAQSCLFVTPWTAGRQASLSFIISQSLLKFMSIESVMPSSHLILCHPLLLLPSIFLSIRVFSNKSALRIRWPKYWSFSFSIGPSNDYSELISFRIDWFDPLAVQGTLKSLQSFLASGSFLMRRLFTSGGQNIGASASASVLPMNFQGRLLLGLTDLIPLLSKGLSREYYFFKIFALFRSL